MSIPDRTPSPADPPPIEKPNPWFSMWLKPRQTILHIVTTDLKRHVFLLAALSGVVTTLNNSADRAMGDNFPIAYILGIALLIGGLGGLVRLAIEGWLFSMVGGWLGGEATSEEMRAASAWSSLPSLIYLILYIPIIMVFGASWFMSDLAGIHPLISIAILTLVFIVDMVSFLWRAFMLISSIAELHGFSAWKAIATILIGYALAIIPTVLILLSTNFLRG